MYNRALAIGVDTMSLSIPSISSGPYGRELRKILDAAIEDGVSERDLYKHGIKHNGFMLKTQGMSGGYNMSLWAGDVRMFFSTSDHICLYIQIGAETLARLGLPTVEYIHKLMDLAGIEFKGEEKIKISRIDPFIDVPYDIGNESADELRRGWIGLARKRNVFGDDRIQTLSIGKRGSPVYLRIYDKITQALEVHGKEYLEWLRLRWSGGDLDAPLPGAVTRIEWEVKPKDAGLPIQYLDELNEGGFKSLLLFLLQWGRLTVPSDTDTNSRRWELHPLWKLVTKAIEDYSDGQQELSRTKASKEVKGLHQVSIGQMKAYIAHSMAEIGHKMRLDRPLVIAEWVQYIGDYYHNFDWDEIWTDAIDRYSQLAKVEAERRLLWYREKPELLVIDRGMSS